MGFPVATVVAAVFLTLALNMVAQRLPVGMPVVTRQSRVVQVLVVVALVALAQLTGPLEPVQVTPYRQVPHKRMPLAVLR
jgi:hypothetical protein